MDAKRARFEAQVLPHLDAAYRYARWLARSPSDADDLLQETWLRIHEVRHTYRRGQPLLPWLYAIARNTRVDHYRKSQRKEWREMKSEFHDLRRELKSALFEKLSAPMEEKRRVLDILRKAIAEIRQDKA